MGFKRNFKERIIPPSTTDESFYSELICSYDMYDYKLKEICLKKTVCLFS